MWSLLDAPKWGVRCDRIAAQFYTLREFTRKRRRDFGTR